MTTLADPTSSSSPQQQPAYSPGLEGVVAGVSQISKVSSDIDSLIYRGYDVRDLAEHCQYEEVAYLLLYGHLPTQGELDSFKATLATEFSLPQAVIDALAGIPKETHPMDVLRTAVSMLAAYDPQVNDMSADANRAKAVRLMAKMPTAIATAHRLSQGQSPVAPKAEYTLAENFLYTLSGQAPDPQVADVFDTSMILYAEHGFNASTFSARVTCSTLADFHCGIVAAIGTLKGPLHGGANEEAMKMLLEVGSVEKAKQWITDALAQKKKIMGFGHRVYKNGDSRAPILKALGRELCDAKGESKWADMADIIEGVVFEQKGLHPNVDFPTSYIYYVMGLPIPLYTPIFAMSRIAGWGAHIVEQLENNRLIRPKSLYEGPAHMPFVPIQER